MHLSLLAKEAGVITTAAKRQPGLHFDSLCPIKLCAIELRPATASFILFHFSIRKMLMLRNKYLSAAHWPSSH